MTITDTWVNSGQSVIESKLLTAMYSICRELNRDLDYQITLPAVLKILHEQCALSYGLLAITDPKKETVQLKSIYAPDLANIADIDAVSYRIGEGIIGSVMEQGGAIVLPQLGKDSRFSDKLAIYDYDKPFISVPIKDINKSVIGSLSAQPTTDNVQLLHNLCGFLEMIANLITTHIQFSRQVTQQQQALVKERDGLKRKVRQNYSFNNLVGHTGAMRKIFEQIRLISRWDSTILIRGESGTGKELIANAIHYNSSRSNRSFVKLNCAALPENLLESELFGHEKGAFTSAVKQRKGRFELADGGTLFLDEIGETSPAFQSKLLRVLQERTFERVGGTEPISVDVRILAATHRNLEELVQSGEFREDIYYRLNVMPIYLPALRERKEDIPELAQFILEKFSKQQKRRLSLTDCAIRKLLDYEWPGNVRELENTIERACILSEEGQINQRLIQFSHPMANHVTPEIPLANTPSPRPSDQGEDERSRVIAALEQAGWVKAKAARLLNMTPRQIAYRIQTLNIETKEL
ncbi:nif-specific transcriptional activator NifA [Photobacterium sp. ZSDE20]|uniref:Nif-specific regulatory protein n=1 Tax=Photobacterium pectinilyticum TaxID=2906793 RepID=A0ABT1N1K4_9GAMM|nr:nif-specific transcriptional activator NifA [Photobacterium sp. ZSDE20]MCQ1058585.1 nif-specific transcriptional activator NifA [Photobacterium sp. ZSDE20]MDD1826294.1 nif-specific transcriptional activator NifA [Photobacterium sp. ZSDE20]